MPRLPKNVYRRGSRFYFRAKVHGREVRMSLGPNLQEARRRASLLRQRLRAKPEGLGRTGTVAEFGQRWLAEYVRHRRTEKDQATAGYRFREHVVPVLGDIPLGSVRVDHLLAIRDSLEAKGQSPQTVRHVLSDVRCLLRYAVEVAELDRSPWRGMVLPRIKKRAPDRLTDREVGAILEATPDRFMFVVRLALETGLRWGELRRLQWRHVVWEPNPHLVVEETKSGEVRRVPLTGEASMLLKEERLRTSSVFVLPWRPKHPGWVVDLTRKRAGIRWHFHQLRHTFACRWLERSGSKEVLRRILGHASITTTERYGELSDEAVFAEVSRLGDSLEEKRGTVGGTPPLKSLPRGEASSLNRKNLGP